MSRPAGRPVRWDYAAWWLRGYVGMVFGFLLAPVVVVMLASINTSSHLTVPPKGITLHWFVRVLQDPEYLEAIGTSLALAGIATGGSLLIGTAAAYALVRRAVPLGTAVTAFLMAPLIFPGVVIGVALLRFYVMLGVAGSFAGLALAHMVITVPYVIRCVMASLSGTDPSLEDAARCLGANRLVAFVKVTLPLIRPGVVAGAVTAFIISFDNVPVSIFLLSVRRVTLPVRIFNAVEYGVDPSVAAISTLLIVATAIGLALAERWAGFHRFV